MTINENQNKKLLTAVNSSIKVLKELGFADELRNVIDKAPVLDEKKHIFPNQDPIFVKDLNDVFKPKMLVMVKQKLNTAPAVGAAIQDVKNSPIVQDVKSDDKIKQAMTHFVRLRLLFTGMSTGEKEYDCVDLEAPVVFPDIKEKGAKLPLALEELRSDPKAELNVDAAIALLSIIKNQVEIPITKLFGTTPKAYATSIGRLEQPPRFGMLHELKLGAVDTVAAFVFSQNKFYYVNKALNKCQLLADEKNEVLQKYLPADNNFKLLSVAELEEIGFKLPVDAKPSLKQQLDAALEKRAAEAQVQVGAAAAAARVEENARWLHVQAAQHARITDEYEPVLDESQAVKAQNEKLLKANEQMAAENAALVASNAGLNPEMTDGLDELPPDIAALISGSSNYGLFDRRNYIPQQPPVEPVPPRQSKP